MIPPTAKERVGVLESESSLDAIAAQDAQLDELAPLPPRLTKPALEYAAAVCGLRDRPRWSWGFPHLDRAAPVPTGSLVYVIGATGRGKSSLALQIARMHAESCGPALVFSAELAAEYACARLVSQVTQASWYEVTRGGIDAAAVQHALDVPRLRLTDAVTASWARDIENEIGHEVREHPGELVLVVVDYLQVLRSDGRDTRERVANASTALREIAARTGAVILALSKASRVAARGLRSGELVGSDATEVGAETNSIEHDAVAQVQLGVVRPADDDAPSGTRIVDLSVAKARFGTEDVVIPFQVDGAHGWFREHGEPVSLADRKAAARAASVERRDVQAQQRVRSALAAIGVGSRNKIVAAAGGTRASALAALDELIAAGEVVEVQGRRNGGRWPLALADQVVTLELRPIEKGKA